MTNLNSFIALEVELISVKIMMCNYTSNQVLCNVWSYDIYDITLHR